MKTIALLVLLVSSAAYATGTTTPPPPPPTETVKPGQHQTQTQQQTQSSTAVGGKGGSATGGSATGGKGGKATGGSNTLGDTSIAGDSSDYRSLSLFLPQPAFTPPMAMMNNCDPNITQSANAFGFGLFSNAMSHADPTDCTLMSLRNAKVDACQYEAARQIENGMIAKYLPNYTGSAAPYFDLDPKACALVKSPPPPPVPQAINFIAAAPVVEPKKPKVKKKPCPPGQSLVCKPF